MVAASPLIVSKDRDDNWEVNHTSLDAVSAMGRTFNIGEDGASWPLTT